MSVMGVWIVGAVPDAQVRDLAGRFSGALDGHGLPHSAADAVTLAWWRDGGDKEPFFEDVSGRQVFRPTDAAERFAELFLGSDSDEADELWEVCLGLVNDDEPDGLFVASTRKASPVAALFYGLGALRSGLLPGAFGAFLLTHREVEEALPRVERVLRLTPEQRARVLQRIGAWMDGMGDKPDFDAAGLVEGPLRVLRHAADSGRGVAAFSRWY